MPTAEHACMPFPRRDSLSQIVGFGQREIRDSSHQKGKFCARPSKSLRPAGRTGRCMQVLTTAPSRPRRPQVSLLPEGASEVRTTAPKEAIRTGHVTGNQEAIMRQPEVINDPLNLGRASTARSTRAGATAAHVAAPMGASKTVETSRARSPLVQRGLGFVRALLHAHQLRVDGMSLGEHEPAAIRRNHVRASLSIAPRSLTS